MSATARRSAGRSGVALVAAALTAVAAAGLGPVFVITVIASRSPAETPCGGGATAPGAATIALQGPGSGARVGATEYGGPGDPSSGQVGASGADLLQHPDSYAELGGLTFQTATAMGGLPYMTPLRITWGGHSAIAYKRDFGLGGGPIDGLPRVIDLWWRLAEALGIPYRDGRWSGAVRVQRPPPAGAGDVLAATVMPAGATATPVADPLSGPPACAPGAAGGVPTTSGPRAQLLRDGRAAAPAGAPAAVRGMIAAGNEIVGRPYVYGAAHGLPLSEIAPAYDCSSSVEHLLYGGGLVPVTDSVASGALESFGAPGPGRWVTIYASPDHVFMYVAGLRWDTHNAAGSQDGSTGIGWHPLVRSANGFVARHPVGL